MMDCNPFPIFYPDKTCRSCLSSRVNLRSIPMKIFTYCTSLPITEDDGFPTFLCQACYDLLNNFYFFKQQCIRSESILRQQRIANADKTELNSKIQLADLSNEKTDSEETKSDLSKKPIKSTQKKKSTSKLLYCQKCDKTFYKYVKLEAHMRKHFGLKPDSVIKCNQCEKTFTTEKNLKSHLRVHTGERKYKCKSCGKAFAYSNVLKNHERAHAGIKKYGCQQCGKKFVQLTNLNTHMQLHTGEKPYSCGTCGRCFRQISELKMHLLRHTGVKDFACDICSLRFYTNFSLRKHMGVHSDARPFVCSICEKRFKSRSYMIVHQRTHTGERPFRCDFCSLTFISAKDRRNHRKTHTGERSLSKLKKTKPQQLLAELNVNAEMSDYTLSELTPLKSLSKSHCGYADVAQEHYEQYQKTTQNYIETGVENKNTCLYINAMYSNPSLC